MTATTTRRAGAPAGAAMRRREFEIRADDIADGRTFTGVAVPWDDEIVLWASESERVAAGAVNPRAAQVFIYWRHGEVIGAVTGYRDTAAGWEIDGRLSDTSLGRDAAVLLADGVITKLSIGFVPVEWSETVRDDGSTLITYTDIDVREVSLVPMPAYDNATITSVRERATKETPMPETLTRDDLTPLTDQITDLERAIGAIGQPAAPPAGQRWRSMGEFLKSVAAGDADAAEFHRAYTGATTADTVMKDSFVGEFVELALARRRHVAMVSTGVLPAEGMSVDYVKLKADTTAVDEQDDEGDDLPLGKIQLEPANAPVKTYGGATQLSRQLIHRSTVATLDITLDALGRKYAARTDAAVRAAISALITARLAATDDAAPLELASDDADGWLEAIIDAALRWETAGYDPSRLVVSVATFKALAKMKDGDQRVMAVWGTNTNKVGSIDLPGLTGNLSSVTVTPSTAVPAGAAGAFLDPAAVKFLESPGAPAKLQDSNVLNLTEDFSLYGYASTLTPVPEACLPITPPGE